MTSNDRHLLVAKLDDVKIYATSFGMKFTVESLQCLQANAFLQAGLFYNYVLKEQQVSFKVNLSTLLDCLGIFGMTSVSGQGSPSLKMFYDGYGEPLVLTIEEGGVVTNCCIKTLEADPALDFDFTSSKVVNKIILKAEGLREAFSEIDPKSEVIEILMSPDKPYFRLTTFTECGDNYTEISSESDFIDTFSCTQTRSYRYKSSLLRPSGKVLQSAEKVSIRTDKRGFLSLQFMINVDGGQPSFVEYLCVPDERIETG